MSKRWEYLTIEAKTNLMLGLKLEDMQAELSKQGKLGWELVKILTLPGTKPLLIFKREL
ncbi:Domain of unknown function (DUF4177) [Xanthomonas bromi]|uniref:DUF4177 domain-containing protein n=1 Tax=Xanthomonas bromi TaxID=56449 RepID=A0A1C3NNM9_9XANT|nr:DUF4177 domain-containing protein [Xanthomonas bromi]PPV06286.1 DUF4177 domain-containing protein [Xanthomonas bromi]SBV51981.1 Domain of unknown function (DUF4177) [Xanthomonas bromi]